MSFLSTCESNSERTLDGLHEKSIVPSQTELPGPCTSGPPAARAFTNGLGRICHMGSLDESGSKVAMKAAATRPARHDFLLTLPVNPVRSHAFIARSNRQIHPMEHTAQTANIRPSRARPLHPLGDLLAHLLAPDLAAEVCGAESVVETLVDSSFEGVGSFRPPKVCESIPQLKLSVLRKRYQRRRYQRRRYHEPARCVPEGLAEGRGCWGRGRGGLEWYRI